jgi:hypothetical protein
MYHISYTFHVKNLGHRVRRLITLCDLCQRVKHPNRKFETESKRHTPKTTGELCAVDLPGVGASVIC